MSMTKKVTQSGDVEGDLLAHQIPSEEPPLIEMFLCLVWTSLWEEINSPELDQ